MHYFGASAAGVPAARAPVEDGGARGKGRARCVPYSRVRAAMMDIDCGWGDGVPVVDGGARQPNMCSGSGRATRSSAPARG
jgi:hypothetical protein